MYEPGDEDLRAPVEARRRIGHNYLILLAPVALVVAVVGFGIAGKLPESAGAASPSPSAVAAATHPAPTAAASPSAGPAEIIDSETAIAAIGNRVFYTVEGRRIESVVSGASEAPATVVNAAPCEAIGRLEADGQTLVYVTTKHATPTIDSCVPQPQLEWTIWSLDVATGQRQRLAAGMRLVPAGAAMSAPVHVGVGDGRYAFDRVTEESAGDSKARATIEVHSLATNELVWSCEVTNSVQRLVLGGNTLVIMTSSWGTTQVLLGRAPDGPLETLSSVSSGASISDDGRYVVWDSGEPAAMRWHSVLMLTDLRTGETRDLGLSIGTPGDPRIAPAVSETPRGPVVAWHAPRAEGGIGVRVLDPEHPEGTWADGISPKAWMSVQGDRVVWLSSRADGGKTAGSLELASLP